MENCIRIIITFLDVFKGQFGNCIQGLVSTEPAFF